MDIADEEWEQETKYRNRGEITMKSDNVEPPDLVDGLDLGNPTKKSIPVVKWTTNPIDFYEIGEDVDQFEVDAKEGGTKPVLSKVIEKKTKSADKEWDPESKYRNQGTITMKSQKVSERELRHGPVEVNAPKKPIVAVTFRSEPIDFYEIGDDVDQFELDSKEDESNDDDTTIILDVGNDWIDDGMPHPDIL
uniref:Reverse transcriptase domain-containing protein n=1 Tax=Caenorhabditis tropicalis TaxID=1561998 RepID=A0A1I7TU65_9PELO